MKLFEILVTFSLLMPLVLTAEELPAEKIPEPMTLKYALSQASRAASPEIMNFFAQRQIAQAEQELAISEQGFFAEINGRLRYIEPADVLSETEFYSTEKNDSKISLDISKRLYDFGRSNANIKASQANLASVESLYADYVSRRKVTILQAYFNVLLADIIFSHANEAMSVDYVLLDKVRSSFELQKISDIELLKVENDYRQTRRERTQALSDQRLTRHRLAQLITPGKLSVKLVKPDLAQLTALSVSRKLQEIEQLYTIAYKQNPQLIAAEHQLHSVRAKLDAFQADKYPVISGHFQAADYAREFGSSDKFRAGIEIKMPLYQAGQENSRIKRTNGELIQLEAEKLQIKQEVEQQILELWLRISDLQQQSTDPDFTMNYRDLYLDRSRALYELEVTSDLGDAMVELSQAQLFKAQTVFELAVAWAKLDSLLGNEMNYYD